MQRLLFLLFSMRARRGAKYMFPGLLLCVAFMFTQCGKDPDPVPVVDKQPPKLTAADVVNIGDSKADLKLTSNEAGKLYWVVLADGATKPAKDKVKNSSNLSPAPVAKGSKALVKGANPPITITGLDAGTAYDLHYVAEDKASPPNLGDVGTQDFTTTGGGGDTAPTLTIGTKTPTDGGATIDYTVTGTGSMYWAVLTGGTAAPADAAALKALRTTATTVHAVSPGGTPATAPGAVTLSATGTITLTGLPMDTDFDLVYVTETGTGASAVNGTVTKVDFMTGAAGSTAPTLIIGTKTPTNGGATIDYTVTGTGSMYWAVLTNGTTVPANATALKALRTAAATVHVVSPGGTPVTAPGAVTLSATGTITLTGLAVSTDFDLVYVTETGTGATAVNGTVTKVDFRTGASGGGTPIIASGTFAVVAAAGGKIAISLNSNMTGTVYWVAWNQHSSVVNVGTVPADPADVAGATQGDAGGTAISAVPGSGALTNTHYSGSIALATMGSVATVETDALFNGDSYILYVVVQNGSNNSDMETSSAVTADNEAPASITLTITAGTNAGELNFDVGSNPSEVLTVYWITLGAADAALTSAHIVAGKQSDGTTDAPSAGSVQILTTESEKNATGVPTGNRHVYAVVTDAAGNIATDTESDGVHEPSTQPVVVLTRAPSLSAVTTSAAANGHVDITFTSDAGSANLYWAAKNSATGTTFTTAADVKQSATGTAVTNMDAYGMISINPGAPGASRTVRTGISLVNNEMYTFYVVVHNGRHDSDVVAALAAVTADNEAPASITLTITAGTNAGELNFDVGSNPSEVLTVYWITLGAADAALTSAHIVAGKQSDGTTDAPSAGSVQILTTESEKNATGVPSGNRYVYAVVTDAAGNIATDTESDGVHEPSTQPVVVLAGAPSLFAVTTSAAPDGHVDITFTSNVGNTGASLHWAAKNSATGTTFTTAADVKQPATGTAVTNMDAYGMISIDEGTSGSPRTLRTGISLMNNEAYTFYVVVHDGTQDSRVVEARAAVTADNTAPTQTITAIAPGSNTGEVNVTLSAAAGASETLTVYWITLNREDAALTSAHIIAGKQSDGTTDAADSGEADITAADSTSKTVTGVGSGDYFVYAVLTDSAGNATAVAGGNEITVP